jgi:RNA polymerase sigma-70 factor (ECF subfamily)
MGRYEQPLIRYCSRFLGDTDDAEDVCQDVMLRVFHHLPGFEARSSFKTWLFRLAHNQCVTRYRRRLREREVLEEYATSQELAHAGSDQSKPDLNALLNRLGEEDRTILLLRYEAGLSFQEVADALELGLSATKMRIYRAAERMAKLAEE